MKSRQQITADMVQSLEAGVVPWRMPWYGPLKAIPPYNVITRQQYRGVHQLILQLAALKNGFRLKGWGTQEDWRSWFGCQVLAGSIGTEVDGLLLFNVAQVNTGRARKQRATSDSLPDWAAAEKVMAATPADIRHTSDVKAEYYYPPLDFIVYPKKDCFIRGPGGLPAYYESLAHELIHWSQARIGFEADYATCELLAEIGSCFWASKLGLPNLTNLNMLRNHVRFVGEWCAAMRANPDLIFEVAASADKAAEFILAFSRGQSDTTAA